AFLDIPKMSHKWIVTVGIMLLVMGFSASLLVVGLFFEPFSSLFTVLLAAGLAFLYSLTSNGAQKSRLHQVLGNRISYETLSDLLDQGSSEFFHGENREVTVLSLRVFNLDDLREQLTPPDLIEMSNQFVRNSAEFLASRGAYLDESLPDRIRVFFGIYGSNPDHPLQACRVAKELEERLANLNLEFQKNYFHEMRYGVAIATGPVTLGIYRSPVDSRLSAIGELGEYAHKLSGTNHAYGSHTVINAETFSLVRQEFAVRPMELMYDARSETMEEAYELLDLSDRLSEEDEVSRDQFWQGVVLYREGRAEEALQIFSSLQAKRPLDQPLQYFIDRCQARIIGDHDLKGPGSLLIHGHARLLQSI
ncbi:MAG: hypothetical protein AAF191_10335, partial [Verrucomicrobiota bacterium]